MKINPTIFVDVSPEYFYLTLEDRKIRFATFMNIKSENGKIIPIAIGQQREIPGSILMDILDFDAIEKLNTDKITLLQIVLEYGIGKLLEKYWFPPRRPILVFRGYEKLRGRLGESYKTILETSAMQAGARLVRFE